MAESKVKRDNYLHICGWMITDLNLKGNELLVYAIIYGFSQDGEQRFSGSLQYLADWTNSSKQGVSKCLKSLVDKGLICKIDKFVNGVKFCEYYATKFNGVCNKVVQGMQQSLMGGMQQSCTNNIDIDNIEDNKEYSIVSSCNKKRACGNNSSKVFIPPTVEEVAAYCKERNNGINPERFVDYYESNGWKVGRNSMKDWKAAVRTWERNGYTNQKQQKPQTPNSALYAGVERMPTDEFI